MTVGSSATKTHQAFTIAPSILDDTAAVPVAAVEVDDVWVQVLVAAAGELDDGIDVPGGLNDPAGWPDVWDSWIATIGDHGIVELAGAAGFAYPELATINPANANPLEQWLNPTVDEATKTAIQTKAIDRYQQLAAGTVDTIGGYSLADLTPPDDAELPVGFHGWTATAAQLAVAQSDLMNAVATPSSVAVIVNAENRIVAATVPGLDPGALTQIKAAATAITTTALSKQPAGKTAIAEAFATDPDLVAVAGPHIGWARTQEALLLIRASTPTEQRALINTELDTRVEAAATVVAHHDAFTAAYNPGGALHLADDDIGSFTATAGAYLAAHKTMRTAALQAIDPPAEAPGGVIPAGMVTGAWRSWAKHRPLPLIRAAAVDLGLDPAAAASASRAQLQNYVAAHWDPAYGKTAIAASITTTTPDVKPGASSPTPPGSTTAVMPSTAVPSAGLSGVASGWGAKQSSLVAALKHHDASHSGLPRPVATAAVNGWGFPPAANPMQLGGAHTKSLHTGPDGATWMFKPDKTTGGARADAEASAATIMARAGLPAIPCYRATIGGKPGSVQPLAAGCVALGDNPTVWSQADVDAVVRYHVAAWAIGDHDGHGANMLRTPAGGLVACDHGQAFKFFGQDRLSSDYHPNGAYGAHPPVYAQAYQAAKNATLAAGVTVRATAALGTLAAFEAIPDDQYRTMLYDTAHHGATSGNVHWYQQMRHDAAKQHATKHPTVEQIANVFLDRAVTRKQQLRQQFKAFFTNEQIAGADTLDVTF